MIYLRLELWLHVKINTKKFNDLQAQLNPMQSKYMSLKNACTYNGGS